MCNNESFISVGVGPLLGPVASVTISTIWYGLWWIVLIHCLQGASKDRRMAERLNCLMKSQFHLLAIFSSYHDFNVEDRWISPGRLSNWWILWILDHGRGLLRIACLLDGWFQGFSLAIPLKIIPLDGFRIWFDYRAWINSLPCDSKINLAAREANFFWRSSGNIRNINCFNNPFIVFYSH